MEKFVFKAVVDGAIKGLQEGALRGKGLVVEEIDTASPYPAVDTGGLRQSVDVELEPKGASITVDAPHAAILELGTRPFWPPKAPLAEWAMRKGLAQNEDEAYDIAGAIQRKFAREGMAPRHYFSKAMNRLEGELPAMIKGQILDEFKRAAHRHRMGKRSGRLLKRRRRR